MIRTNVIGNCPEKKGTPGTRIEEYFDDRIDATKAYDQLLVNILVAVMPMIALALVYFYGY